MSNLAALLRENRTPGNATADLRRASAVERDKMASDRYLTERLYSFLAEAETSIQQQILDGSPSPRVDVPLFIANTGFTFVEELAQHRDVIVRTARDLFVRNLSDLGLTFYTDSGSDGEFIRVQPLDSPLEQHGDVGTFDDGRRKRK